MELRSKIKQWWDGKIVPYENDPNSYVIVIAWWQNRHWTSRACHAAVRYVRRHHQWLIGLFVASAIGIAGVLAAIK